MKESTLLPILVEVSVFLVAAALIIPLLKRFKVPSILGYLLVGLSLGPYGLAQLIDAAPWLSYITLENSEQVKLLAELGIVLLLFVIGLEISPKRLWEMRRLVFGLGTAQVVVTGTVIGLIAYAWGNTAVAATLIGASFALSSTAIVFGWISEQKLHATTAGRASFGILLLQDIAVIPILFLLSIFAAEPGQSMMVSVGSALLKMVVMVAAIYLIGQRVLRPLFVFANRYGGVEVFMALTLLVIVSTAVAAGLAGLSLALGAFLAGLLLAETEYRHEIMAIIEPFKGLLLGIFFLSFGMSIDIAYVLASPFWLAASVAGLLLIKGVIVYVLARLWGLGQAAAVESALLLPQAGEFGLLVVGSALTMSLIEPAVGQFMLIVVGLTMLLTPLLAVVSRRVGAWVAAQQGEQEAVAVPVDAHTVVLAGYGRMGKLMGELLCSEGIPLVAFDHDATRVHAAKSLGVNIFFGDVTKANTRKAMGLQQARLLVLTVNNAATINKVVREVRKVYPQLPIVARAADVPQAKELEEKYDVQAVPEHLAISLELAEQVLEQCGLSHAAAHELTEEVQKKTAL